MVKTYKKKELQKKDNKVKFKSDEEVILKDESTRDSKHSKKRVS